jgi:hypothetical protein
MKNSRLFVTGLAGLASSLACKGAHDVPLPSVPPTGLAFAVLYDGDTVSVIGPVVDISEFYAEHYLLTGPSGGLQPRLFVVDPAEVTRIALAACDQEAMPIRRLSCKDAVNNCAQNPNDRCLAAVRDTEDCGDRLPLVPPPSISAYAPDASGRLNVDELKTAYDGIKLCGPRGKPNCADRKPGFTVMQDGEFRCFAPATQLACDLSIDLGSCGIGRLTGSVDMSGTVSGTVNTDGCTVAPLTSAESMAPQAANGGFSVTCGMDHFVALYVNALVGVPNCPRHGPGLYDGDIYHFDLPPLITGMKVVKLRPTGKDLLMWNGMGADSCAEEGCAFQGAANCGMYCTDNCKRFQISGCVANMWAACAGDGRQFCAQRCSQICQNVNYSCPARGQTGRATQVTNTDQPETDIWSAAMADDPLPRTTLGPSSLAVAGEAGNPILITAARRDLYLWRPDPQDPNGLVQYSGGPLPTDLLTEIAGVLRDPDMPNVFYVYGVDSNDPSGGRVVRVALQPSGAVLTFTPTAHPLPSAPVELAAVAAGTFYAASTSTVTGAIQTRIDKLATAALDAPAGTPIMLPGRIHALIAIGKDRILAAMEVGGGMPEQVLLIDPTNPVDPPAFPALTGLHISALTALSDTQAYVGFEAYARRSGASPALIGVFSRNIQNDSSSQLTLPLVQVASTEVTMIELNSDGSKLFAVSATENTVTAIDVVR